MPIAAPLIAAITGLRTSHARGRTGDDWNAARSLIAPNGDFPGDRSAPAQNAVPAPVSTTTRTSLSASHAAYSRAEPGDHLARERVALLRPDST